MNLTFFILFYFYSYFEEHISRLTYFEILASISNFKKFYNVKYSVVVSLLSISSRYLAAEMNLQTCLIKKKIVGRKMLKFS